jgi:hypothetical protein
MYRQSIHENKDRFSEAVKKVIELKNEGIEDHIIPEKLATYFQEKEIKKLLIDFEKLHSLKDDSQLKLVLKLSLWLVLILRSFSLAFMLTTMEMEVFWMLIILLFGVLVFGAALFLAYKESFEFVFIILLLALLLSTDSIFDNFEVILTSSALEFSWWFILVFTVGFIVAIYSSWRLRNIYKSQLFKLNSVIKSDFPDYVTNTV